MYFVDPKFAKMIYEINDLKNDVAKKIVERDSLIYHVCKNLKVDYMLKIGSLEYKLFKIQNEVLITKRKIEIVEDELLHKNEFDIENINQKVKIEFAEFEKIEKSMLEDIDISIDLSMSEMLDTDELEKINNIYLELQKRYNPILNINTKDEDEEILKKIEKAYRIGSIKKLENILKETNQEMVIDDIENLEKIRKRYNDIIKENARIITKIKNTFPYNQKNLLDNENLTRRKKNEINDLIYFNENELAKLKRKFEDIVKLNK